MLNLHKYSIARDLRSLIGSGLALSSWPRGCKVFSQRPFLPLGKGMLLTADPVSRGRKQSHERQLYQDPGKDLVHPKLMAESNRKVAGSNFGTRLVFEAISSLKRPINNNLCIFYCTEIHSTPFWTRTHALQREPLMSTPTCMTQISHLDWRTTNGICLVLANPKRLEMKLSCPGVKRVSIITITRQKSLLIKHSFI